MNKERNIKREKIIREALTIFANKGYHASSMAEIAKAAGIAKGSVYTYFDSKDTLLRSIVFEAIVEIAELIDPDQDGKVTNDEFFGMIRKSKEWLVKNREFQSLYFSLITQPPVFEMLKKEIWEIVGPYMQKLTAFFAERGFSNPETEVRFFVAMLDGIDIHYVIDPKNFPIDEIEAQIIQYYEVRLNTKSNLDSTL